MTLQRLNFHSRLIFHSSDIKKLDTFLFDFQKISILFHVRGYRSFPGLNFHSTDVESEPAVLKDTPPPYYSCRDILATFGYVLMIPFMTSSSKRDSVVLSGVRSLSFFFFPFFCPFFPFFLFLLIFPFFPLSRSTA